MRRRVKVPNTTGKWDSKVIEVLMKLDNLSPWSETKDLHSCWYGILTEAACCNDDLVFLVGNCAGVETKGGSLIVVCKKHAEALLKNENTAWEWKEWV